MIDEAARTMALDRFGIPESLHIPIAAVSVEAIVRYIGEVRRPLSRGSPPKALLVLVREPPPRDLRLPIWDLAGADLLHKREQVWVDVAYTRYRQAYASAFPDEDLADRILSHAMNRRVAALKGFRYVRITPASRAANSSSAFSESWGAALHGSPAQVEANRRRGAYIQYADLTDLMLMLDLKLGGGVMDAVNEGQRLVRPRE